MKVLGLNEKQDSTSCVVLVDLARRLCASIEKPDLGANPSSRFASSPGGYASASRIASFAAFAFAFARPCHVAGEVDQPQPLINNLLRS